MHEKSKTRTWAVLALLPLMGCVNFESSLKKKAVVDTKDAYVYGRFPLNTMQFKSSGYATVGLEFKCLRVNSTYSIGFSPKEPLQVIRIPGGDHCSLANFVFTDGNNAAYRKPVPAELRKRLRFEAGTAYYLGDFEGRFELGGERGETGYWSLTGVRDDFEKTTREMKSTFRNVASLPTENSMIHP